VPAKLEVPYEEAPRVRGKAFLSRPGMRRASCTLRLFSSLAPAKPSLLFTHPGHILLVVIPADDPVRDVLFLLGSSAHYCHLHLSQRLRLTAGTPPCPRPPDSEP
jgi:hypothetical protein